MQDKKIILVKLGGGLIAPKDWPSETPDVSVIKRLIKEIEDSQVKVIVAVGSGNYGHSAVKKYGIDSQEGVGKVRTIARKIGEIVAYEIRDSQLVVTHNTPWRINGILQEGKVPVIYGDVMGVGEIWSGERCITEMLPELIDGEWKVGRIIQAGIEEGVWDANRNIVPKIDPANWGEINKSVGGSAGTDVTGGMLHKVEESLAIAHKYGIKTWIVSGRVEGRLEKVLRGENVPGTVVG
jgi:isopentenyl phosphate kinase